MGRDRSLKNLKRAGQPDRMKGVPNRATVEVREASLALVQDPKYRENLARRLRSGRLAEAMETTLWHYAYGKPKEAHEYSGDASIMTRVVHEHYGA
jgi:hypothetical protein